MRSLPLLLVILTASLAPTLHAQGPPPATVLIAEVVADPKTDWNKDAKVTASDEFVELHNAGSNPVELAGWTILLNDTTPERLLLAGTLAPGQRRAFINPPGEQNNNGHIAVLDAGSRLVDEIKYGSWPANGANLPPAGATGPNDEALRLTDARWTKGHATPDASPTGPLLRPTPAFPVNAGQAFDAGATNRTLRADWADADRSFQRAEVVVQSDVTVRTAFSAVLTAGRWAASGNVTTPISSFSVHWELVDNSGRIWSQPETAVVVDRDPPMAPHLDLPGWTNLTTARLHVDAVEDAGVGGVTYAYDRDDGGTWTRVVDWTNSTEATVELIGNLTVRPVARDAFGWSVAGPASTVRFDPDAPVAPRVTSEGGYDSVALRWTMSADPSGVAAYELSRTAGGTTKSWRLSGDLHEYVDRGFALGDTLVYTLRATDGAGNVGPFAMVNATYTGIDPRVRSLRVDHPVWGTTDLRVHVDFDRVMDASVPRVVLTGTAAAESLEGRWLVNRSTFLITVDGDEERPEGEYVLRVEAAVDGRGRGLTTPVERTLVVDRSPPLLNVSWLNGWIGPAGLHLAASDVNAPVVRVRLGEDPWTTANGSLVVQPADGTRIRAVAVDAAGLKSREIDRIVHVDLEPPIITASSWKGDRLIVDAHDAASGVASIKVFDSDGAVLGEGRTTVVGNAVSVELVVVDNVGNVARSHLERPGDATVGRPEDVSSAESPRSSAPNGATPSRAVPMTAATGGVGLAALGILGLVRRQRAPKSLGVRVRRLRARDSTRS